MKKENIVFYIGDINYIGGVETWIYNICNIYSKEYDITLLYNKSAPEQLKRLKKMIKCIRYTGQDIECNKFIYCYDHSALKTVKAKEYILTIHADYKVLNLRITIPPQTTSIYAVSETAKQSFIETHKDQLDRLGLKMEVLYNPLYIEKPRKVLHLVSPQRLTKEKGGERIKALARRMNERGIPFAWLIFSDTKIEDEISGLAWSTPNLHIIDYIADADFLINPSDTEGYAYSIVEALAVGTPVVITPLPIKDEMKCNEGNSIILDFDLSNLDEVIDKMYNSKLKFKYEKNDSDEKYRKIFGEKSKSNYIEEEGIEVVQVIIKNGFFDIENNILRRCNTSFECTNKRAMELQDKRIVKII